MRAEGFAPSSWGPSPPICYVCAGALCTTPLYALKKNAKCRIRTCNRCAPMPYAKRNSTPRRRRCITLPDCHR